MCREQNGVCSKQYRFCSEEEGGVYSELQLSTAQHTGVHSAEHMHAHVHSALQEKEKKGGGHMCETERAEETEEKKVNESVWK